MTDHETEKWPYRLLAFWVGRPLLFALQVWCVWKYDDHDFMAADGTNTLPDCNRCGAPNKEAGYD